MRLDRAIAVRLAYLQGQRLTGDSLAMGETVYWGQVLTDDDRRIYQDMAREAIKMTGEAGGS